MAQIRVFILAREMGVTSKAVLKKCRDEGVDIKNHQSSVSAGLAATIKEWFSEGAHETTIEKAEKVNLKKVRRPGRKKAPAPPEPEEKKAEEPTEAEPPPEAEPVVAEKTEPEVPLEKAAAPTEAEEKPSEESKVVEAKDSEPPAEPDKAQEPPLHKKDKAKPKPIAKPFVPAPAQLRGPKVVRMEKPDFFQDTSPPPINIPVSDPPPQQDINTPRGKGGKKNKRGRGKGGGAEVAGRTPRTKRKPRSSRRSPRGYDVLDHPKGNWRDAAKIKDLKERQERLDRASGRLDRLTDMGGGKKAVRMDHIEIPDQLTVKDLSGYLGVKVADIIKKLFDNGVPVTVNQTIGADEAELVATDFGIEVAVKKKADPEAEVLAKLEASDPDHLELRAPVVTFLGHVDHGKTSLLDWIRHSRVVDKEAGGITQHIGAYRYDRDNKHIVFLDTPGHEAFTSIRARGANMTDVVVLVVAADDGVMPQTVEAIHHAQAAEVPVLVALNKIDRGDANENKIFGQLAEHDLAPPEWGGKTEVIRTSATTGEGMDKLLETLSLEAEMLELKADPTASATGAVIEAEVDPGLGVLARILVRNGTLRVGDVILAGTGYGKVRNIQDDQGRRILEAPPSTPIEVAGLDELPEAGDRFWCLKDLDTAREIALARRDRKRSETVVSPKATTLESLFDQISAGKIQRLPVILRADVQGSLDVLKNVVSGIGSDEVKVEMLHSGVGGITEGDVLLAEASKAILIGFHVVAEDRARSLAEKRGVEIRTYNVIYELTDAVRHSLEGMLTPDVQEKVLGRAEVREIFRISKVGNIAGCMVMDGLMRRNAQYRLIRDNVVVRDGLSADSLRRVKDDAREVANGLECGIKLAGCDDIQVGDRLECVERIEIKRKLE